MIRLELNNQSVKVDDGELVGYAVDGHEFIHQKGSPGWGSSDTEMFPIIGPVNESGFQVKTPEGSAIQDQHGHLRQFLYELIDYSSTQAVYQKAYQTGTPIRNSKYPSKSTEEWLNWPYDFVFEKRFILHQNSLEISFTVSGDSSMPFMLGYHPAFKLHSSSPIIQANSRRITLDEILTVGSRALEVSNCNEICLIDDNEIIIKTEGFGHFMCWTEVRNMVCIEPITFYPYAVEQQHLHQGFQMLDDTTVFKVWLHPKV